MLRLPFPTLLLLPLLSALTTADVQVVTLTSTLAASTVTLAAQATSTSVSETYTDSNTFQTTILNSTNYFRYLYPAQYLQYNASLASFAQTYSEKCIWQHNTAIGALGFGENLAKGYPDTTSAVDAWGNEVSLFSFSDSSYTGFSEATGHFTQLVWRGTQSVGCGWTNCNGKHGTQGVLLVCNYFPAGNVVGSDKDGADPNMYFKENLVPERQGGGNGFNADDAGKGIGGPSGTATESVAGTVTASAAAMKIMAGGFEGWRGMLGSSGVAILAGLGGALML